MKQSKIGVGVLGFATIVGAQAEEAPEMEAVTVWATEVRASSVNLDQEAIATKQADHISDLLRTIPGVDVGGAHSLNQRITIRSMDDKDLRITIDGANQNTYMYHHMGNLQINANILQSADIEVGNNSVINGGLGGVVRFETKQAKDLLAPGEAFGAHVQYSYADNASQSFSATGYGQISDQFDYLVYGNALQRDNFKVGGGEIKDSAGQEIEDTDGTVRGLEGDLTDVLVKLGWDISSNQRFQFGMESYVDEGDYSYRPDMGLATDLVIADRLSIPLLYPTEFTRDTYTLNYDLGVGDNTLITATLFQNVSELWRDETGLESWRPALAGIITGEATNSGLNVFAETFIEGGFSHEITYGLDVIKYDTDYSAIYIDSSTSQSAEEAQDAALFIQDRVQFDNGFAMIPGVRFNKYDIESAVVDDTYTETTAALALEYQLNSAILLHASSTQLFKGPEIGEVFAGAGLYDLPNPDIKAETGYNHELAIAIEGAEFNADAVRLGLTLFQTDINDYIYDYISVGRDNLKDNVGDMRIDGYEAYIGFDVGNLSVLWTYSKAQSELKASDEYQEYDGARIDREQGNTQSWLVGYEIPSADISLHWDALVVGSVDAGVDLDASTNDELNKKDGYMVHNIAVNWTPRQVPGLTVTAGVDNLFDEYYASQSSRTGSSVHPVFGELYLLDYEPGRNIKTTVAYQF